MVCQPDHCFNFSHIIFLAGDKMLTIKFEYKTKAVMKVLLDIKDDKADFVMELLENFNFVKTELISPSKARFLEEFKQTIEEVNLAEQGKLKVKSAEQLIDEL
jgi:hypothetical protein